MWDATPGHATPGAATPGRDTPGHATPSAATPSARRNRWDETPKTERGKTNSRFIFMANTTILFQSSAFNCSMLFQ